MGIRIERDEAARMLLATSTGLVTVKDVEDFASAQDASGAWSWRILMDSTKVEMSGFDSDGLSRLAEHLRGLARGRTRGPIAIIATPERAAQISSVFTILCGQVPGLNIGVFQDRESAERWLAKMPSPSSDD